MTNTAAHARPTRPHCWGILGKTNTAAHASTVAFPRIQCRADDNDDDDNNVATTAMADSRQDFHDFKTGPVKPGLTPG
jgi:hypothetical protein